MAPNPRPGGSWTRRPHRGITRREAAEREASLQEIEDERWREAARILHLEFVDADGTVVPTDRATQADRLRGRVDGRRLRMRYGLRSASDRTTVLDVRLRRPLLLGLAAHAYRDPAPRSNRYGTVPRAVFSSFTGIEDDRARALFGSTPAGDGLAKRFQELGSLGWAEMTDNQLRLQSEVYVDGAQGWVSLVRSAVEVAGLAESARDALPPRPWETLLVEHLETEAKRLDLLLDKKALRLEGTLKGVKVSVALEVREQRYALFYQMGFPVALPSGSSIKPRARSESLLAKMLGLRRSKPSREDSIDISGVVNQRLSASELDAVAALAASGDIRLDEKALTLCVADLDASPGPVLDTLVALAAKLAARSEQPYRG
jgi:hypothetical protein